nr:histidine phosphatase family protein [Xanthomonas euroxanthea]
MLRDGDTGQRSGRGQLDDPLAAPGWQQLRAATADGAWGVVVASTLQRCALFVIKLATARALPLHQDPRLRGYPSATGRARRRPTSIAPTAPRWGASSPWRCKRAEHTGCSWRGRTAYRR